MDRDGDRWDSLLYAGSLDTDALASRDAETALLSDAPLLTQPPSALFPRASHGPRFPKLNAFAAMATEGSEDWSWQVLPDGLIYRSYLAGRKEPRFASQMVYEQDLGWIWDVTLGGRVGILRYGTRDTSRPEGLELDMEGAGMPRLDMEHRSDVMAADFRFGLPLTYGIGRYQTKFAFYHLSSHLGDEYMLRYPDVDRINYSRNALVWGHSYYLMDDLRLYAESAWAFTTDGGSKPWEFQFGIDYSPVRFRGLRGSPFAAINSHLREDVRFGGNMVMQTGWQWRGESGHLFRMGMEYFNGMSEQFEFYDRFEEKVGMGIWYDF